MRGDPLLASPHVRLVGQGSGLMLRQNPPFYQGMDGEPANGRETGSDPAVIASEVDAELQAAIEYKIAMSGLAGVATVLQLLKEAVRRHV